MELEPPEVPITNQEVTQALQPEQPILSTNDAPQKKEGFFSKLFSWSKKEDINNEISQPMLQNNDIPLPPSNDLGLPDLPELPHLGNSMPFVDSNTQSFDNIPKKRPAEPKSFSKSFDWASPLEELESMITTKDDTNRLLTISEEHINEQKKLLNSQTLLSEPEQIVNTPIETPNIPESHVELSNQIQGIPPALDSDQTNNLIVPAIPKIESNDSKDFRAIDNEHQKLRAKLQLKIQQTKNDITKKELMELFKRYDERIERRIEDKELSITNRRDKLEKFHNLLKKKEHELKELHNYLKKLDEVMKDKESKLDIIINKNVDKLLIKRGKKEKLLIRQEIKKTQLLNALLEKKLSVLENDRKQYERKSKKLLDEEHAKLTAAQIMYDKKIKEIIDERKKFDEEKSQFEKRRNAALELLNKGDIIAKELAELENVKLYIDKTKSKIKRELNEDKELKHALQMAEHRIVREKKNIDNMVFAKYIESKLKSIVPETIAKNVLDSETSSNPDFLKIMQYIEECRRKISSNNLSDAKRQYNHIKRSFETGHFDKNDRMMLLNAIRTLYTDIQLVSLES